VDAVAILPVKRFGRAKQRLSEALGAEARAALAEAMLRDVLLALARVPALERTIVVTGEPRAAALAGFFGAEVVPDDRDAGQSAAAVLGQRRARELGAARALFVPGDCPALDPDEITALLARHPVAPAVAVVPDRHGTGTNALLLAPPDAIEPGFGPGSRERHEARARAAGIEPVVEAVESLAYDVDTGGDLAALRAELARRGTATLGTTAVLDALERGEGPREAYAAALGAAQARPAEEAAPPSGASTVPPRA
jgi:2-phospho-L-lactate guanylyltransferase